MCIEYSSLLSVKDSLGSFGAYPVFDDLVSTFDLHIQGSLYCEVDMLLVFFN